MNKTAIAFLTKDRVELSRQSALPLLNNWHKFDTFWIDGSVTEVGRKLPDQMISELTPVQDAPRVFGNVRGGAGAAIVFALTKMLEGPYDYIGLHENDVLCDPDWFDRTFALFQRGLEDGLQVGAVSARCYEDRVLFQRDGYAVLHNTGAGLILFSRAAARLVLDHFRSGWTTDNRRVFCQLSGVDIGPFWAFKGGDHNLVADWHFDTVLAVHGFASLALTPSPVQMIGQDPPLTQQGLTMATGPVTSRIDEEGYKRFLHRHQQLAWGEKRFRINVETKFQYDAATHAWTYLPHQLHMIGGSFSGDWRFKEMRAFGEFGWVSGDPLLEYKMKNKNGIMLADTDDAPSFSVPVYGNAMLLVSGGKKGGTIHVKDESSGYEVEPFVAPEGDNNQCLQIPLPAQVSMRTIRATFKSPGLCFYRLVTSERQPDDPTQGFDHSYLPEPV